MCWFAGVLAGGEACSIYARRNGNVQMCRCTNRQAPGEHGGEAAIYTYTCAHARAHVLHFEAKLCAFCTNNAFLSDNQRI